MSLRWRNRRGIQLEIRRVRPDDAEMLRWGFGQLSRETLYKRFFGSVRQIPEELLRKVSAPDPERDHVLVAVRNDGFQEAPVGLGRFRVSPAGRRCEFALVVGDRWQGQGIGRCLLDAMIGEAQRRGLQRIEGMVLADNQEMIALARTLGFATLDSEEGPTIHLLRLELAALGWLRKLRYRGLARLGKLPA